MPSPNTEQGPPVAQFLLSVPLRGCIVQCVVRGGTLGHGHMVKVSFLSQAREVASKRPGKDPVTLPPSKRVRALPPAQAEGSPMGADGGQVSSPRDRGSRPEGAGQGATVTTCVPTGCPTPGTPALPAVS